MLIKKIFLYALALVAITTQTLSAVLTLKEQAVSVYFTSRPLSVIKSDLESNKLNGEIQEALMPLVINKYKKQLDAYFLDRRVKDPPCTACALDVSLCGKYVLTGAENGSVYLWSIYTGQTVKKFEGHSDKIISVTFAPDNESILTISEDSTARTFSITTGETLQVYIINPNAIDKVKEIARKSIKDKIIVSPNEKYGLISKNGQVNFWDISNLEAKRPITIFKDHANSILSMVFSADNRYALIFFVNNTVQILDLAYAEKTISLKELIDKINPFPYGAVFTIM
jgi:WD40 repeat protein